MSEAEVPSRLSLPFRNTPVKPGPPDKWLTVLERVTNEAIVLARYRTTWRTVNDLADESAAIQEQPYFVSWVSELYGMTMALGVRKIADGHRDAASLFNLLKWLAEQPERLTREWFLSGIPEDWVGGFDRTFTDLAAPNGLGHIDPQVVLADQQRLVAIANPFRLYVNQHVAHAQAEPDAVIPKFGDVNTALDEIIELLTKYELLLARRSREPFEPVFQFPWERVFERPWIEKVPRDRFDRSTPAE